MHRRWLVIVFIFLGFSNQAFAQSEETRKVWDAVQERLRIFVNAQQGNFFVNVTNVDPQFKDSFEYEAGRTSGVLNLKRFLNWNFWDKIEGRLVVGSSVFDRQFSVESKTETRSTVSFKSESESTESERPSAIYVPNIFEMFRAGDLEEGGNPRVIEGFEAKPVMSISYLSSHDFLVRKFVDTYQNILAEALWSLDKETREKVLIEIAGIDIRDFSGVQWDERISRFIAIANMGFVVNETIELIHLQALAKLDTPRAWARVLLTGFDGKEVHPMDSAQFQSTAELARYYFLNENIGTKQNKLAGLAMLNLDAELSGTNSNAEAENQQRRNNYRSMAVLLYQLIDRGATYDDIYEYPEHYRKLDPLLDYMIKPKILRPRSGRCALF